MTVAQSQAVAFCRPAIRRDCPIFFVKHRGLRCYAAPPPGYCLSSYGLKCPLTNARSRFGKLQFGKYPRGRECPPNLKAPFGAADSSAG